MKSWLNGPFISPAYSANLASLMLEKKLIIQHVQQLYD